jgi:hypothetical protein
MPEPIFMKIGMYIMAPEPISMAYFVILRISLYVYPTIVARQRLRKNVTVTTYTHVLTEELLTRRFICGPCLVKGK